MDELIKTIRMGKGYKPDDEETSIIGYADDTVLVAESEDDLQRLLFLFNKTTVQTLNMIISADKTRFAVRSKKPRRCKLEVDGKVIQQVMFFKYLGTEISSSGNVENEVRQQVIRANKVARCLKDIIWRNKYMDIETKVRIYKATVRLITTYRAETGYGKNETTPRNNRDENPTKNNRKNAMR